MRTKKRVSTFLIVGLWLLNAAFLLVLLALGGMGKLRLRAPSSQPSPSQSQDTELWQGGASTLTMVESVQRAEPEARAWAGDAVLVRAEAAWRTPSDWQTVDRPEVAWSLYYYSAAEQALVSVVVSEASLFWVPPMEMFTAPTPIQPFPPAYGIDKVWLSFRAAGGEGFLREHPKALIDFRLRHREDMGVVWVVSALHDGAHFEVSVDAQSGLVVFVQRD